MGLTGVPVLAEDNGVRTGRDRGGGERSAPVGLAHAINLYISAIGLGAQYHLTQVHHRGGMFGSQAGSVTRFLPRARFPGLLKRWGLRGSERRRSRNALRRRYRQRFFGLCRIFLLQQARHLCSLPGLLVFY